MRGMCPGQETGTAMKILVINTNREKSPWPVVPIGACRVATALEEAGHEVAFLDLTFEREPRKAVREKVSGWKPEAAAVSIRNVDDVDARRRAFYIPQIKRDVIEPLRAESPGIPVTIGGSAVNVMPELLVEALEADYAVVGDGERAAAALFDALAGGARGEEACSGCDGLVWRTPEGTCASRKDFRPDRLRRLERHPASRAWKWVDVGAYAAYGSRYGIQTKRGCACKCTYCSYPNIEGCEYRYFPPSVVADEIEEALERSGMNRYEFVDSTFNLPREHALAVLRELERRRLDIRLDTMGLNPRAIDEELIGAMKSVGFTETSCTPESAHPRILESLGKGFDVDTIAEAARVLRKEGLPTKWYFMFGAPGEDESTVASTFEFIDEHISGEDLVLVMTGIRVLPGTALERRLRDEGTLDPAETLFEPWFVAGELGVETLERIVAFHVAKRPNCCHVSGELWNVPVLMKLLHRGFSTLGMEGTGWGVIRLVNRIRSLWRR